MGEMSEIKGLAFDVQGFSIHDGPGCRTSVFLSGCPLHCEWCANPEGLLVRQRLMFSRQRCKQIKNNCTRCRDVCPHNAVTLTGDADFPVIFDRSICDGCSSFECTDACYYEAARLSGKWMSVSELMDIFRRDRQYWIEGGVTFTGGEPFAQYDFLVAILEECRKENIHVAIETTAHVETTRFLSVMEQIDFAFIDLKHMDSRMHKEKTRVANELIKANIRALKESSWKGRLILRMPVIANYNDTEENINATIQFMKDLDLFELNILPFHRMGVSKWEQLGMEYPYQDGINTPGEVMEQIQAAFLNESIACYVGEEIYY